MTEAERRAALEQVASEVRACTGCRLHEGRTEAVPGEGHPSTEVLLVGEAPGLNEDRQGRPFVGAAGGFLTELLGTVGWSRDEVFITNVVKCRPPQNRDPEPDEIAACAPYLRRQVEILHPALVITLGRHSMGRFMPGARIGQVHGTTASPPAETGASDALVFAMYHPAAALHQGSLRQTLLDDMGGAPAALLEARRRRQPSGAAVRTDEVGDGPTAADEVAASDSAPPVDPQGAVAAMGEGLTPVRSDADEVEPAPPEPAALAPAAPASGVAAESAPAGFDAPGATDEAPLPMPAEPVPGDMEPALADRVLVDASPALPPAPPPGADAPGTDQMTLF